MFTLGDNVYPNGTAKQFLECYDPSWGRHKARTRPVPGNHDYRTQGAAGYFGYFGGAAGDPRTGYYAYDLGTWRVLVLNSNCRQIGGCGPGSAQEKWLKEDLAANPGRARSRCGTTRATPRASTATTRTCGTSGRCSTTPTPTSSSRATITPTNASLPRTREDRADPKRGIREFVVGTGGRSHYSFGRIDRDSEIRNNTDYGVLKLTLHPSSYDWEFIPVAGGKFRDSGTGACH